MRILVVGAGAIGGYFGARLAEAGRDVTFLVRRKRAEQLAHGLYVRSPKGDVSIATPKTVTEATLREHFDLVLLSCKSFDLAGAIESFSAAMGPNSVVLPLLNGLAHIDILLERFGKQAVMGGQCQISTTLDAQGRVVHLNDWHTLGFGELDGTASPRLGQVSEIFANAGFDSQPTLTILRDMWEKWIFIASMAGITCLMRAALGDIVSAGGESIALSLFEECGNIAGANGHVPRPQIVERIRKTLAAPGSTLTASMLRDMESGKMTEHEHVLGDLLGRARGLNAPVLALCLTHLRAYEARRMREARASNDTQ
jgi:2-dehydropantoate 2-reductase